MTTVALRLNGDAVSAEVEPRTSLADLIRDHHHLTGTHLGCEHGVCGACTVIVDGAPIRSCITLAVAIAGAEVTTIEGLDEDPVAAALRTAFSREHALQCGYCTPGVLIAARDFVIRADRPNETDIRVAMSGNLCRCTGYRGIVQAVAAVIEEQRVPGIAVARGATPGSLGPIGSGHGAAVSSPPAKTSAVAERGPGGAASTTAPFEPQSRILRSFTLGYPRKTVWRFLSDPAAVAGCLPGASVNADPAGRNLVGALRVKLGPIVADFHGEAEIERDEAAHTGKVRGGGVDGRTGSAARGEIAYELIPKREDATEVKVAVAYALSGPLAQFGRSRIVEDIASRLTDAFVANLTRRLAEPHAPASVAQSELQAGGLLLAALGARLRSLLSRLFGRGG